MASLIPHSRPTVGEEEAEAATAAVRSGQIAEGPRVAAFEAEMARYLGRPEAVALSSGFAALQLALHALGVSRGDPVVVPSYNCAALAQAVRHLGAEVRLCDVDPRTGNPTPETVAAAAAGARAVIVTHLFGRAADAAGIAALGLPVVEDLAQGLGARRAEGAAGSFGDLAVCSFYATKLLATGEGGMVLGNDPGLLGRVLDARSYDERPDLLPRWNYKLTDVQAAIGLVQIRRFEGFIARRREIAARYTERFSSAGLLLPADPPEGRHVFHRYVVGLPGAGGAPPEKTAVEDAVRALESKGVAARRPVHRPLHLLLGEEGFPGAEEAWRRHLSLPIYPSLTEEEAETIMRSVCAVIPS
ncbi:MAG: DegT/DnrJ/EryC1/StrS family aminotransferase [Nitrospinota bacterium]